MGQEQLRNFPPACFIGIGGTGARVLESFVHLCAMGLGPKSVMLLVIDTDSGNGNLNRTRELLNSYLDCRRRFGFTEVENPPIFSTDLVWSAETQGSDFLCWSPASGMDAKCLRDYFQYDLLQTSISSLSDMLNLLYKTSDLNVVWDKGFSGRPSIGAPVFARAQNLTDRKPWSDIVQGLQAATTAGQYARVFIVGSVFGGMGAAGFPTVARVLRNIANRWQNSGKLLIGGAPLLPYFQYIVPPEAMKDKERVYARPENFLVNTAAALRHYVNAWGLESGAPNSPYNAVFLLGNQELDAQVATEFALGGNNQKNRSHFIELYAALAAAWFLNTWEIADPQKLQQYGVGRYALNSIGWTDVPEGRFKDAVLSFTTFAFEFLGFGYPLLVLLRQDLAKNCKNLPWYLDHFSEGELKSADAEKQAEMLKEYLVRFFYWLRDLHRTSSRTIRFIDHSVLQTGSKDEEVNFLLKDDKFRNLRFQGELDHYTPKYSYGYDTVWEKMCNIADKIKGERKGLPGSSGMGKFAWLLYQACKEFTEENYQLKEKK